MTLTRPTFDALRKHIYRLCGLALTDDKSYLVEHRLEPLLQARGLLTFEDLARELTNGSAGVLDSLVIDAITTGETSFFRDGHPFDTFRRVLLPHLDALARTRPNSPIRLWSAACSTGQEPYTLAMIVHDWRAATYATIPVEILATDIAERALAHASLGEYREHEIERGLTPEQRLRYFEPRGTMQVVRPDIRNAVRFRRLNLLEPFPPLGPFEAIFCRNVLIYFDDATRQAVIGRLRAVLAPGGYLCLGATENLFGCADGFETIYHGTTLLYRKRAEE